MYTVHVSLPFQSWGRERCQGLELLTAQCTKTRVLSARMLGRGMARDSASEWMALEKVLQEVVVGED